MTIRDIRFKEVNFKVYLHTDAHQTFWNNYSMGKWEETTLNFLLENKRDGYFLDIGSWIGPVSLLMSNFYEKVISVDLDPEANRIFSENVRLNNIQNIEHYCHGLGDLEKQIEIDADDLGSSTTNIFNANSSKKIKVLIKKFSDFITNIPDHEKINFIKIDCEGAEYTFLGQLYDYLSNRQLVAIISYHPWVIRKPRYYFIKLYHWIRQLKFKRYYFRKDGTILTMKPFSPLFALYDRFPMADVIES